MMLAGRKVLLGLTGGIAAYKGPALVRELTGAGAEVRVVATESALRFVAPLSLQAVSGHPVASDLFDPAFEHEIGHIELARWPDVVLVAPATASFLARTRAGLCSDLLGTVICATEAPVVIAPAMNTQMWLHTAVQENVASLSRWPGYHVVQPDSGELACKEVGAGRLPDPPVLLEAVRGALGDGPLVGRRVLVTAGPTREPLDPVRFLSNHSSGKMGYAFAAQAAALGAEVTLVSGPVTLPTPPGVTRVDVVTAAQMCEAVLTRVAQTDIVVKVAAVADWRPAQAADHKRKKTGGPLSVAFERTQDILATLGNLPDGERPVLVGFAAETGDVESYARGKVKSKNLDYIVANIVGGPNSTFGADDAEILLIDRAGTATPMGPAPKGAIARAVLDRVASETAP